MKIGVAKESVPGETRVALVPETVGRLGRVGRRFTIEASAGDLANFSDKDYELAGADIVRENTAVAESDVVVSVQRPDKKLVSSLQPGTILISLLQARSNPLLVESLAAQEVTVLSMELVPRIARAQSMDVLSSQASIAGYKAVLIAATSLGKYFPMLMTAAGTVPPAKVLVLGAGVAGLQAIATARRLGSVVEAYDVRAAAREQVESLGAVFIEAPTAQDSETAGGYAREQTADEQERQRQFLKEHVAAADALITTAGVPGRPAPRIVTNDMVESMRPGSVIVDVAAESGGNVEATKPGEVVDHGGVLIHGPVNIPALMAWHASTLYSRNVQTLLDLIIDRDGNLNLDFGDEIIDAMCVTHGGELRDPMRSS